MNGARALTALVALPAGRRGDVEKGGAEKGGAEKGGAEKGGAEKGGAGRMPLQPAS